MSLVMVFNDFYLALEREMVQIFVTERERERERC